MLIVLVLVGVVANGVGSGVRFGGGGGGGILGGDGVGAGDTGVVFDFGSIGVGVGRLVVVVLWVVLCCVECPLAPPPPTSLRFL